MQCKVFTLGHTGNVSHRSTRTIKLRVNNLVNIITRLVFSTSPGDKYFIFAVVPNYRIFTGKQMQTAICMCCVKINSFQNMLLYKLYTFFGNFRFCCIVYFLIQSIHLQSSNLADVFYREQLTIETGQN